MAVDGHLNFDTRIDEKGFDTGVKKLTGLAKSGVAAVGTALAGVTAALGAGVTAGVKYNATIEQYQTSFEVMTGSAEKAAEIVQELTRLGAETPFEMTGLADTTQLLMNYGFTAEDALDKMMMLGDISQGSADKMNRIAMAYGQMSSAGKVQLEDIKQMIEAGFNPLQEISQSTGESMESLYDRISKGTISVDEITASMERSTSAGGKYFQSMEKQSQTVSGQLSTLGDNVQQLLGSLSSGVSQVLGEDILPAINDFLGNLNDAFAEGGFQGFLDELGNAVPMIQGLTDAAGELAEKLQGMSSEELLSLGKTLLTVGGAVPAFSALAKGVGIVKTATEGFSGITDGIASSISKLPGSLKGAGDNLSGLGKTFGNFGSTVSKMGKPFENFGSAVSKMGESFAPVLMKAAGFSSQFLKYMNIAGGIGIVVAGLGLLYNAFGGEIDSVLQMVQTKGPEVITDFCNGISSALPELIAQGATLITHLLDAITANIPAIVTGGIQILSALVTGISQQLPQLIPAALQMVLTLVQSLIQNIPQLISAGMQLLLGLVQGVVSAIPTLIAAIPSIIQSLVSGIVQSLPTIITTGIQLLSALISGVIQAIPDLLNLIPQIFQAFVDGITSVNWLDVGKQILTAIKDGILSIGSSLWDAVKGIFTGGSDEAAEEGRKTGEKYAEGVQSTTASAQMSATSVADATTSSFATTLNAGSVTVSTAAMNLGTSTSNGLQLANVPGTFSSSAQTAVNSLTGTLGMNAGNVSLAGQNLGSQANAGIVSANMSGTFSQAGTQAGQSLGSSLTGQTGTVAAAANAVSSSASGVDLSGAYASAGSAAMESLAGSISSGTGSITSAATAAANAAITGLASGQMPQKAKSEGNNFIKSLSDSLKSGTGTVRTSVTTVINAAKLAVNGLGSAGQTAGLQFSNGLAIGIRSGQNGVAAAAAQVANAAVESANKNLDINSPSRVGEWIGEMFDRGIERGLVKNADLLLGAIDSTTDLLSTEMENALMGMKKKVLLTTSADTSGVYRAVSGKAYGQQPADYTGILDEWEQRQKRINRERDDRPIILNNREVNRATRKKGDIKV
ncbi:MAG TPA: tape measure protein [Candidatus Bariatricus faecipullorum]|nr:tape measure protein [Candidatus Bariatricus faecipullorum]